MHHGSIGGRLALLAVAALMAGCAHPPSCQSNIVSSTVVATFCGHDVNDGQWLDLVIVWRGRPGWFLQNGVAGGGSESSQWRPFSKGLVSQHQSYGDTMIQFDADFDANTVIIGQDTVSLERVNMVVIDHVGGPGDWRVSAKRWIDPPLPRGGDVNVTLARRSRDFLDSLRCDIPMPAVPPDIAQVAVVTVCEKLGTKP